MNKCTVHAQVGAVCNCTWSICGACSKRVSHGRSTQGGGNALAVRHLHRGHVEPAVAVVHWSGDLLFGFVHQENRLLVLLISDDLRALEHVAVLSGTECDTVLALAVAGG